MDTFTGTSWLWWTALIIALGASGVVYFISQDEGNIEAQKTISTIVMFSVVAIGLCVISATSRWWIKR